MHTIIHRKFMFAGLLALLLALGLGPAQADSSPANTVNLNTATAAELAAALNGVGASRAEDIVRYREAFGPFTTLEQLTEVKGIGQATINRNRKVITLD